MNQKLQAKDLITIGVFTAILFVVCFTVAMLGFLPIFIPLLSVLVPLIGGVPFMLYTTKAQKFGMTTMMGVLIGILNGMMGHGVWVFLIAPLCGLTADLIMRSGGYRSAKKAVAACGVFFLWILGNYIPILLTRAQYYRQLVDVGFGQAYADTLMKLVPDWSLILLGLAAVVCGILGGMLGRAMLKKHFRQAGIV